MDVVHLALGEMQGAVRVWDKEHFGSVRKELVQLRRRLEHVRHSTLHSGPSGEERDITRRLAEILAREEVMEKQRSRVD